MSYMCVYSVAQSFLTLCNPMDYSLSDSFVHGSFQARTLERVTISYSKGSSWPRDRPDPGIKLTLLVSSALAGGFFTTAPPGKLPNLHILNAKLMRYLINLFIKLKLSWRLYCFVYFATYTVNSLLRKSTLQCW